MKRRHDHSRELRRTLELFAQARRLRAILIVLGVIILAAAGAGVLVRILLVVAEYVF